MEGTMFKIVAFFTLYVTLATSEKLQASIRTAGIFADLEFETSGADVTVNLLDGSRNFPSDEVSVTIHPIWLDHDVKDICTSNMVGNPIAGKTGIINVSTSTKSFTLSSTTLDYLEGKSVVIHATVKTGTLTACGTILRKGTYVTAAAVFQSKVFGSVLFRQHDADSKTIAVNDMISDQTFTNPAWKIVEKVQNCEDASSMTTASKGDLNNKFGQPTISQSGNNVRSPSSDADLPLTGSNSIVDKYLVVFDQNQASLISCAKIRLFQPREAIVLFSHQGIKGHISFMQPSPLDVTNVSVLLEGLNSKAGGYHVHLFPVPAQIQSNQELCSVPVVAGHYNPFDIKIFPSPKSGTDDQYEIGDLSSKYGTLVDLDELSDSYTDWNLPLFGKHSIVGRSVVIHRNDLTNSRWVCSNIHLKSPVVTGVAVFKYPVIGHVYFTQAMDMPNSDTHVFVQLGYLDDRSPSSDHMLQIHTNKVGYDMLDPIIDQRCSSIGSIYNPFQVEGCTSESKCELGDLSGKHGNISIGTAVSKRLSFYSDTHLPLSGHSSILGRSIAIMNSKGILACASIEELHKPMYKIDLKSNGVSGHVSFSQEPGFGLRPTKVSVKLTGFKSQQQKLQIYSLPPIDGDKPCSDIGSIYDPLNSAGANMITHDQYKVGDLSRGGSEWQDLNLPLSGQTSVGRRSLAVVDSQSKVVACGVIQAPFSKSFDGYLVSTQSVFRAPLEGYIDMFQILYNDGTMSDTSVIVNLKNMDNSKTIDHNWHVHVNRVSGDADATSGRCASAGPHYDPYMAKMGNASTQYGQQCFESYPLRCELGDQANKLGTYSLGLGRKVFTDVDLPLNGMYKTQGRSIVVHVQNKGAARYACADIYPISDLSVTVKFTTPLVLDLSEAGSIYANAIGADLNVIVVQVVSNSKDVTTVHVYFLGLKREMYRAKFLSYFAVAKNRNNLSKYAPLYDPNKAGNIFVHGLLLLTTLLTSILFSQYL